ncbi:hypothetical protein [Poseidonibacter sp.]|uniref:hypothetical protein n=1 Tax=Poseidonibacter sp. TaxID=2321188 RepID=UPI003C726952
MLNQIPLELISNFISIVLIFILFYKYLQYKKKIDVMKELSILVEENNLSEDDKKFIIDNEKEYKEKVVKTEASVKFSNPVFILITGLVFITFPLTDAMIHLNVVVVAFLFMQVDRIHKKNLYKFLFDLESKIQN